MTQRTPQEIIADTQRRMLAGEEVTDDEIKEAINLLRNDRAQRSATKAKEVSDKKKLAEKGEDLLGKL